MLILALTVLAIPTSVAVYGNLANPLFAQSAVIMAHAKMSHITCFLFYFFPLQVAADAAQAVLSEAKFAQLDQLLSKTDMYTQFLTEQMAAVQSKTEAPGGVEAAVQQQQEAAQAAVKGKRKGVGKAAGGRGGKRQKGASGKAAAADASAGEGSSGDGSGMTATKVRGMHESRRLKHGYTSLKLYSGTYQQAFQLSVLLSPSVPQHCTELTCLSCPPPDAA